VFRFIPSLQAFLCIHEIPLSLLVCKLSSPSNLSLSSKEGCSCPSSWSFVGVSSRSMSLLYRGAQNWTSTLRVSSPVRAEGNNHLPQPAGSTPPNTVQDAVRLLCCKGTSSTVWHEASGKSHYQCSTLETMTLVSINNLLTC